MGVVVTWRVFDLSSQSFDEFILFLFDRPAMQPGLLFLSSLAGYDEATAASPLVVIQHMTKLFAEFVIIVPRFSLPQINQGLWGMFGPDVQLQDLLWNRSVPIDARLDCIRAMYRVYADYVSTSDVEVMENCFDMWWDFVLTSFWFQHDFRESQIEEGDFKKLDPDSRLLLDAMFETLMRILALPDTRTQSFALHGLGHLHHPGVFEAVQGYIDTHREEWTDQGILWLEKCRDGTVM